jgi:hypothetical protein
MIKKHFMNNQNNPNDRNRPSDIGRNNDANLRDDSGIQPGSNTISESQSDYLNEGLTKTASDDFTEDLDIQEADPDATFDELNEDVEDEM